MLVQDSDHPFPWVHWQWKHGSERWRSDDTSLSAAVDSPQRIIPTVAVPAAPVPVHTAYAEPTGRLRSAHDSRLKLDLATEIRSSVASPIGSTRELLPAG